MTGAPDWSNIANVTGDLVVIGTTNKTLTPTTSTTYKTNVIRPSYNMRLELWNSTDTTTSLPVSVSMLWQDSASGLSVDKQIWWVFAGQTSSTHVIRAHGPTEGDILTINITNQAASGPTLTFNLLMVESARAFDKHDWRTDNDNGVTYPGHTAAPAAAQTNLLCAISGQSINANSDLNFVLPLCPGDATLTIKTSGAAGTMVADVRDSSIFSIPAHDAIDELLTTGAVSAQHKLFLPRAQCVLDLFNNSAGAVTVTASMVSGVT